MQTRQFTFEDAERSVEQNVMPEISNNLASYLDGMNLGDEYREYQPSKVRVRKLHSHRLPNGALAKELGKYNPFEPAVVYADPDAFVDAKTARDVLTHEEIHKFQHFSGAIGRYAKGLGEHGRIFIEGGAAALSEDATRQHTDAYPDAKELYRELERRVGKRDALLGTTRAIQAAAYILTVYAKAA